MIIFVYGRAECAFISHECTKVKLLILNNFGIGPHIILTLKFLFEKGLMMLILFSESPIRRPLGTAAPPSRFNEDERITSNLIISCTRGNSNL